MLNQEWTAAGMLSAYWPTEDERRNVSGESTFLLDPQLNKNWDAFAEYVHDFGEKGGPGHLLHFGTTYGPRPRQQLDLDFGTGLSSAAVDHFIGASYSFRFEAVRQ